MPATFVSALRFPAYPYYRVAWNGSDGASADVSYRFMPSAEGPNVGYGNPATGFRPFSPAEQGDVAQIFQNVSSQVNIRFHKVDAGSKANINFGMFQTGQYSGYAWGGPTYVSNGEVVSAERMDVFLHQTYNSGAEAVLALHHEIGHALGLKHPFEGAPRLSAKEMPVSIMSYDYDTSSINFSFFEIAALQSIYGPAQRKLGNDVYVFGRERLLWDGGGIDTVNAERADEKVVISLKDGSWNWIGHKSASILDPGQVYLGDHSTFENLRGSRFDDKLTGNPESNAIRGNAGNDSISGASGNDFLYGGAGNDTLLGGSGGDYIHGGPGKDRFVYKAATDLGSFEEHDRIVDFKPLQGDRLDFSKYDADLKAGGRQKLALRPDSDFHETGVGQFAFDRQTRSLVFDLDGNGEADTVLTLSGVTMVKHSYFLL